MSISGEIEVEFLRNNISTHKYSSTSVSGDSRFFESDKGSEGISINFEPAIVDGTRTYTFDPKDLNFVYRRSSQGYPIKGSVEVVSTASTDNLQYKLNGTFLADGREITIKGTGKLLYAFP
ncbi:hypothetical protein ACMSI6_13225 [Pseudomonas antarctica]|uniref:Uncharacterized protein n=1 Tax=Pseudomonas antarctica TaxID=219572 RepID=A0A1G9WM08_9PSED|nr:hypothetical protein [Pseudomonas antarctica]KAF2409492.1 hypothetical protein PSAN_18970 [Pseudomonas antarctica]SDM85530.1 hypothetical protein SAMN04490179_1260 [Pseudomonas antarctica]